MKLLLYFMLLVALCSTVEADFKLYDGWTTPDSTEFIFDVSDTLRPDDGNQLSLTLIDTTLTTTQIRAMTNQQYIQRVWRGGVHVSATYPIFDFPADTLDILNLASGNPSDFYGPSSSGDGITPVTLYVMDNSDTTVISKARIVLASLTDSSTLIQNISTASGFRVFTLDINDSFLVFVSYESFTQTNDDSLFVTGTLTDTIFLTPSSLPAASPGVNYVIAYMDVGTGMVDSTGAMIPVTKLKATLRLVGESNMMVDTLWGIIPQDYVGIIDSVGRVTFRIPANTIINPAGSHYELSFSKGRTSIGTGPFKKFYLDTIPDPVNILNATEVP